MRFKKLNKTNRNASGLKTVVIATANYVNQYESARAISIPGLYYYFLWSY